MSCITCHDPHHIPSDEEQVEYYRAKCLQCHTLETCTVESYVRELHSPENDCAGCHMPSVATGSGIPRNFPHFAFAQHRIAVYAEGTGATSAGPAGRSLVPVQDVSRLDPVDRDRCLGLAYADLYKRPLPELEPYRHKSREILAHVRRRLPDDPFIKATLADLNWDRPAVAESFVESALSSPDLPARLSNNLAANLATARLRENRIGEAIELLKSLTAHRRNSRDWRLLGICYQSQRIFDPAAAAFQESLKIDPTNVECHRQLEKIYATQGDKKRERQHREQAELLSTLPAAQ